MAHIIVVDDVLDACTLIKRILERSGHRVEAFTEEEDAIDYVKTHQIDLAILDIKLKRMNGVDLLGELKNVQPTIRAVMLTGYPTIETAREAIRKGASEYLVKPIDKQELEGVVAKVLQ